MGNKRERKGKEEVLWGNKRGKKEWAEHDTGWRKEIAYGGKQMLDLRENGRMSGQSLD